jgi:hypothetical protein
VRSPVAFRAQRNRILLDIAASVAPQPLMVYFPADAFCAGLAAPAIALEYPAVQVAVALWIQPDPAFAMRRFHDIVADHL